MGYSPPPQARPAFEEENNFFPYERSDYASVRSDAFASARGPVGSASGSRNQGSFLSCSSPMESGTHSAKPNYSADDPSAQGSFSEYNTIGGGPGSPANSGANSSRRARMGEHTDGEGGEPAREARDPRGHEAEARTKLRCDNLE